MFWHNTIPNASAVLWRREILERAGGAPTHLRVCGDWMAYINVLQLSDIAFVSTPLNYFRQHQTNGRTRSVRSSITICPFRHLWISELLMAGVDLLLVDRMAGTSATMIEQVYGRFRQGSLTDALDRLDGLRRHS